MIVHTQGASRVRIRGLRGYSVIYGCGSQWGLMFGEQCLFEEAMSMGIWGFYEAGLHLWGRCLYKTLRVGREGRKAGGGQRFLYTHDGAPFPVTASSGHSTASKALRPQPRRRCGHSPEGCCGDSLEGRLIPSLGLRRYRVSPGPTLAGHARTTRSFGRAVTILILSTLFKN